MSSKHALLAMLVVALVALAPVTTHASWVENGVPVYSGGSIIQGASTAPDGSGGAFFAWWDAGAIGSVTVERLDRFGNRIWYSGVSVTASPFVQTEACLVSDGAGGIYVVWTDQRGGNKDIYAQHLDGEGNRLWLPDGMAVYVGPGDQYNPLIVHDGSNNTIILYELEFAPTDFDLYAQRLDAAGNPTWGGSTPICTATGIQEDARIVADETGGAIMAWEDTRGVDTDIYAQRVDVTGAVVWLVDGMGICTETSQQYAPALVADGSGGAIAAWMDYRSSTALDIYAQRILGSGVADWTLGGQRVTYTSENEYNPTLAADMTGGAVITWYTQSVTSDYDVYADRLDANGVKQWAQGGLPVCTASDAQSVPQIVRTVDGRYVVAWDDWRATGADPDIYAQSIDIYGNMQWATNGVPVSTAVDDQSFSYLVLRGSPIIDDGAGGVILTWLDERAGLNKHVFAQRIDSRLGAWGRPEPMLVEVSDSPNDQGGNVVVRWERSDRDQHPQSFITHYSLWRAMEPPEEGSPEGAATESGRLAVTSPGEVDEDFTGKAIWVENRSGQQQFWEWVGNQDAQWQPGYSYTAETRCDSTGADPCEHYFKVLAHAEDQFSFWESFQLNGHSVDNLAPAPPLMLTAERVGDDVLLLWNPSGENEPDFSEYVIYRKTTSGVDPVPVNYIDSSTDTMLVDTTAPPGTHYYYVVTAKDVHDNQSVASNEAHVDAATAVGDTPPLTSLRVLSNFPNPFTGDTELRIGLPSRGTVTVEVYDVAGRWVAKRSAVLGEGWRSLRFDGRGRAGALLPSGVYFYRVTAAGESVTRKMIIMR